MSASAPIEPDWLATWAAEGTSLRAALDRFDNLSDADPGQLADLWRDQSLLTIHIRPMLRRPIGQPVAERTERSRGIMGQLATDGIRPRG